jgi:hypothetical protein
VAVGTPKQAQFFLPNTAKSNAELAYQELKRSLVDQFRFPIQERRLFKLSYTNSKRNWHVEVGMSKPQESQYIVFAIFEASVYIVVNRTPSGGAGPIVLVDKAEVTAVEEFRP